MQTDEIRNEVAILIGRLALDRVEALHAVIIQGGDGSPEGVVTAPVGSLWLRANGGAGTTLYVKESGTGNTGWVAK